MMEWQEGEGMKNEDTVRKQLVALLEGGHAHMPFDEAVADFPLESINMQLPGSSYTPWRLLEHMRIAQWDILRFIVDPKHVSPQWPEGYWPPEGSQAGRNEWDKTIQGFRADLQALQELVRDPATDLVAPIPHAPDYTVLREILVAADHNAYHVGEFALFRQVLDPWRKK